MNQSRKSNSQLAPSPIHILWIQMELVNVKEEILGQGIGVGKALQDTVHKTGVA